LGRAHSGLDIRVAPPLEGHPALRQILEERAYEALRIEKSPKLP